MLTCGRATGGSACNALERRTTRSNVKRIDQNGMARKKAQQAPRISTQTPAASQAAPGKPVAAGAAGRLWGAIAAHQAQPITNSFKRYSRFVGRAKLVLPLTAAALLLAVGAWPYFSLGFSKLRMPGTMPRSGDIAEVRMVAPHYIGVDRQQRPFSITAKMARQTGDNDDLMALDAPHADLKTDDGAPVTVTGDSGIYQSQAHYLDLSGNVVLSETKGYVFHTDTARVDLQDGSTQGHDPVIGQGPNGTIKADGFQAVHGGDSVFFTGHADLIVNAAGKKS
jgi:lipopolysaccharide export system protein LptC